MKNQVNQQERFKRFRNRPCGCSSTPSNSTNSTRRTARKPHVQRAPYQHRSQQNRSMKSRFTH